MQIFDTLTIYPFTYQQVLAARRCGLLASLNLNTPNDQHFLRPAQLLYLLQQDLAQQDKILEIKALPFIHHHATDTGQLLCCVIKAEAYILYAGKKILQEAPEDWLIKIFFAAFLSLTPWLLHFTAAAPYFSYRAIPETWQAQAQKQVPLWLKNTADQLLDPKAVTDQKHCLTPSLCPAYGQCYPDKEKFSRIPQRHYQALRIWHEQGIDPEKLSSKQRLVWQAENEQRIFWPETFLKRLKTLEKPWITIDFEVIHSAIPLWPDCQEPLAVIPFAWSSHYLSGKQLINKNFIANGQTCPEELFIESLLAVTKNAASIFVYGSLEKSLIKQLATRHPNAAAELLHRNAKIIDVYQAIQNEFYHPWMQGSWSLKRWTDFFLPEKSFIDHGGAAELLYWQSLYLKESEKNLRQGQLTDYCAQDSWTLWQLIHWLERRGS